MELGVYIFFLVLVRSKVLGSYPWWPTAGSWFHGVTSQIGFVVAFGRSVTGGGWSFEVGHRQG
jgi:hypothetical protein